MTIPMILTDYCRQLTHINLWDAEGLMHWLEEVSFWLSRVDDASYQRSVLQISAALQVKTGRALEMCLGIVQTNVGRVMAERGVRR